MSTRSRRRRAGTGRSKGGALTGLRAGFKKATTGDGAALAAARKKGALVTVVLALAAVAILFYRNR